MKLKNKLHLGFLVDPAEEGFPTPTLHHEASTDDVSKSVFELPITSNPRCTRSYPRVRFSDPAESAMLRVE